MKLQKASAVIGAGMILFAATDAVTYAATGSSLIMGRINQANLVTTIQNTSTGNALRLITKSTTTPPMVVNGRGKVVNLYADRAATADNAGKLGGQTLTQVRAGINAATVGGKTVAQVVASVPRPAGVIWVAKSGGQFTSVSAALASITNNSSTNRYVIKVAPGTYSETASVVLKSYVDIEGSGQNVTTITCACGSNASPFADGSSAVLQVTGPGVHVGIRGLTIYNTGGLSYSTGIATRSTDPGDVSLDDVTATATGGTNNRAIYNLSSSPTMTNVTVTATGGTNNVGIFNDLSSPTMTSVTATATGGTNNVGIDNFSSSLTMTGGRGNGSGGSGLNTGIWNAGGAPTYDTVTATGTGGTQGRGIVDEASATVTLVNVTATGSGGTLNQNWGIDNFGSSSMTVRDSFITGTPNSILNNGSTVRVANTRLSTAAAGIMTCIGAYNATTFAALTISCA